MNQKATFDVNFTVPTCGIANTDPLDMTEDNFRLWADCLSPEGKARWTKRWEANRKLEEAQALGFDSVEQCDAHQKWIEQEHERARG